MPKPNKKNLLFYYTFVYVKVRIHIALCCAYTNLHLGRRSCTRQTLKQNEKKKKWSSGQPFKGYVIIMPMFGE